MSQRDGGKGDTPRPLGVPMEVFDKNFEAIFGKKEKPSRIIEEMKETQEGLDKLK
jgi:hypothetical protein